MATPNKPPLQLDVYADVACPWCFLGKRNLTRALEQFPHPVALRHRAYQLNPEASTVGEPALSYLARKFGSAERVKEAHQRLGSLGAAAGIHFAWEKQVVTNTRVAHRLIALAAAEGREQEALDALYRANFEEGANVGDAEQALAALQRHGVQADLPKLREALAAGGGEESVDRDLRDASELGIDGVPLFLADGRLAVSGAQPPAVLQGLLTEALARRA